MSAPRSASALAQLTPSPMLAPVTITTLPSIENTSSAIDPSQNAGFYGPEHSRAGVAMCSSSAPMAGPRTAAENAPVTAASRPRVDVVIPCYNEMAVLQGKRRAHRRALRRAAAVRLASGDRG